MRNAFTFFLLLMILGSFGPTLVAQEDSFTRQDRLRGSVTPEREWWDLKHYRLAVQVFPKSKTINGSNRISFTTLAPGSRMQIDLQEPLKLTRVEHGEKELQFERDGNVYWIEFAEPLDKGVDDAITVYYEGKPVESRNPPWSGGFSWRKDDQGNHFIATSCQGIGASIWWPNKDHGYDEPDEGMDILRHRSGQPGCCLQRTINGNGA